MNQENHCLFCRVVTGDEQAYVVYNDMRAIAFLDRYPIVPGHTLVVTREHYSDFLTTPLDDLAHLSNITKKVATAVQAAMKADGVRIFTNVGKSAGQVIFHVHIHVIPAWESEPAFNSFRKRMEITDDDAVNISGAIKEEILKLG
ncbi:MAG: HIT domain-containing protein [Nitrososphaerota archaeon]|nr:HIT domain-containing protein [Nitrososphaerota archaeon]MDG6931053.1 HIT domain-containing protein [Nitrososphaerota archaeon]